jgi:hypothetical protein
MKILGKTEKDQHKQNIYSHRQKAKTHFDRMTVEWKTKQVLQRKPDTKTEKMAPVCYVRTGLTAHITKKKHINQ